MNMQQFVEFTPSNTPCHTLYHTPSNTCYHFPHPSIISYNMNMQQFVEFKPDKSSKHLNTIKIQSIAASIRQHGLGE